MLTSEIKQKIDNARQILVGIIPTPSGQIEQITLALVYKFMSDLDEMNVELGGKPKFFTGAYSKYDWKKILDKKLSAEERRALYGEALEKMNINPNLPEFFRGIFKGAFLQFRNTEVLRLFLNQINEFEYTHSENLGDAFEYLLSILGSQGDAGQFRTPRHIIEFIVKAVSPEKTDRILDPACGTAGFLISAFKYIMENNKAPGSNKPGSGLSFKDKKNLPQNITGYDISYDMVRLSSVNMFLHGLPEPKIYEYDTLGSYEKWDEDFDCILANPPFMSPKGGIRPHKRFSIQANRSEVLFVDYIAEHLTPKGKAGIIVPEGIIFQSGNAYKNLRKMLIENYLWAVVSLPAGVFNPYSGVKTSILLLNKTIAKSSDKILFIKIENDGRDLGAQRRKIDKNDLPSALETLKNYESGILNGGLKKEFKKDKNILLVPKEKISANGDYNLSMDRYRENGISTHTKFSFVKLGEIASLKQGKQVGKEQHLKENKKGYVRFIRIIDYTQKNDDIRYIPIPKENNVFCKKDDLIMVRYGNPGLVGKGIEGVFANNLFKIDFNANTIIDKTYAYYILNDDKIQNYIASNLLVSGLPAINHSVVKNIHFPLPPLEIQQEIVNKIDSYQKIIDGAKQIVENYKPQIDIKPEWEMVELGKVLEKVSENINPQELQGKVKYVGLENIESNTGTLIGNIDTTYSEIKSAKSKFNIGDILYGKLRPNLNKVHYSTFKGICSTDIFVLRAKKNIAIGKFYAEYLRGVNFNREVLLGIKGAQLPRVGFEYFSTVIIPLPPLEEQKQIVERIENEQRLVDANKELIKLFEQKIKDEINKVWEG